MAVRVGKLTIAILLLHASLSGCSPGPREGEFEPTASYIPLATPTQTAEPLQPAVGGAGEGAPAATTPVEAPTPAVIDQPASACLIGTWSVLYESLVGYLTENFAQAGPVTFEFQAGQGDLFLTFDRDGITTLKTDGLEIQVGIPNLAVFHFIVQGDGLAQYAADDTRIATWGHVSAVSSEGTGELQGQPTGTSAVILLTPEQIFLDSRGDLTTFSWTDVPEDARLTHYICSGENLSLNVNGTLPSDWIRIVDP